MARYNFFDFFARAFLARELDHMMNEQQKVMVPFQEAYDDDSLMEMEQQFLRAPSAACSTTSRRSSFPPTSCR